MKAASTTHGIYYALTAYSFWGLVPVYFKWVDQVSPWEILSHRIIWALLLLVIILAWTRQIRELRVSASQASKLLLTSLLLSANWLVFIYAVVNSRIAETALGYFINPLLSIFLGVVFLHERLRPLQWVAIAITALAILGQLLIFGRVPWLALWLALSFGFYGLFRKNLGMHPIAGLTIEMLMVAPLALIFLILAGAGGSLTFGDHLPTDLLLMLSGFVTSFPLLCFAAAVTRLSLTAVGILQYIAPSMTLLLAIFVYGEAFDSARALVFGGIWLALAIFTWDAWQYHRRRSLPEP